MEQNLRPVIPMFPAAQPRGLPAGVRFTPVPNPLLADFLEEIEDIQELKLTLRCVWAVNRKKGFPKTVSVAEICADRTVSRFMDRAGIELEGAVTAKLEAMLRRGTLLLAGEPGCGVFCLNTEENRRDLARTGLLKGGDQPGLDAWPETDAGTPTWGAFAVYEQNIGPLTPILIARLEEALRDYRSETVINAINVAVEANVRNWNYIAAVLRSGTEPGGPDGKPGTDPKATRSDEFIRQYSDRQRARGNR